MDRRNPYEVLGIGPEADPEEIKSAFHREALRWHPDRNPDDPSAESRFKAVSAAYEQLRDGGSRRRPDRVAGREGGFAGFGSGFGAGFGFGFGSGRGRGRGCGRGRGGGCGRWFEHGARAGRGATRQRLVEIGLTPAEARLGCERSITLESSVGSTVLTFRLPPDLADGDLVSVEGPTQEAAAVLGGEIHLRIRIEPSA